jgi:hypothetical protein
VLLIIIQEEEKKMNEEFVVEYDWNPEVRIVLSCSPNGFLVETKYIHV